MKISILLDPNPHKFIVESLQFLYQSLDFANVDEFEILIPTSNLSERVAKFFLRWNNVRLIDLPQNASRAKFWNVATDQISADSDFVMLLDLRVMMKHDSIQKMLNVFSDSLVGAVGSFFNYSNYALQSLNILQIETFEEFDAETREIEKENESQINLYAILEGFFMLIKRSVIDEIKSRDGIIANEIFSDSLVDDIDLSTRILKTGHVLKVAPTVVALIQHEITEEHIAKDKRFKEIFKEINRFDPFYSVFPRVALIGVIQHMNQPGIKILDVGCATGITLQHIKDQNPQADLYGIEINSSAAEIASKFAYVKNIDVEKFSPVEWNEKFDYIICGDVIEHLIDPWTAVKHLHKMLKPGGHIIASIPNINNISIVHNLILGQWNYSDVGILDRTHLRFFTIKTVVELFTNLGFRIENILATKAEYDDYLYNEAEKYSKELGANYQELIAYQWLVDVVK